METIEQLAEIAPDKWCRFVWYFADSSYEVVWNDPPPDLNPEERARFSQAKCEFLHEVSLQLMVLATEMMGDARVLN